MARPNILFLLSDEHNSEVAGFAGDTVVRTPVLDSLAEKGTVFTNTWCQSPVCTPSRASLLTGKYISNLSCWNNHWPIFPEHETMAHQFRKAGYETCLVGKMHFGGKDQYQGFTRRPYGDLRHGLGHQMDPIDMFPVMGGVAHAGPSEIPESMQQENVVSLEAAAFVEEHISSSPDIPWFLCASYAKPHSPLVVPSRYLKRYQGKIPPVCLEDEDEAVRHSYPQRQLSSGLRELTPEQTVRGREAYWGGVEFLDDAIGLLLWRLEKAGALDNTIIVYTTDHGDMIGNHGLWWKANYYEQSLRVPFLMCGPGIPEENRIDSLVSLIDLYPTLCLLAGIDIPEGLDGEDLTGVMTGKIKEVRSYAVSEYHGYAILTQKPSEATNSNCMRVIRNNRYKYVSIPGQQDILFDRQEDPREFKNLIDEASLQETVQEMRERLEKLFPGWDETFSKIDSDRIRAKEFASGLRPSTPNQYQLADGRVFDAEGDLYAARWLKIDTYGTSGFIPQRHG